MVDEFKEGIIIEDFDSRNEKLKLVSRSDLPPVPKEIKESLPFVQGDYDFSNILGETFYENRPVKYLFYQRYNDYPTRKINKIYLQNKLLTKQNVKIYDTAIPGYYYLGKVAKADVIDVHTKRRLEIEIELDCYPYMISELPEGHDIWDEFNFELDVAQSITFHPMRSTFRPLKVGDTITIGFWATRFEGLRSINQGLLGRTYKVSGVRLITRGHSERSYYISELGAWVFEQDAVEAQEGALEVNLINAGMSSVAPTIETDIDLTIVREDGVVFNLKKGTINSDLFRLYPGENKMVISGWTKTRYEPGNVKLTWNKELI